MQPRKPKRRIRRRVKRRRRLVGASRTASMPQNQRNLQKPKRFASSTIMKLRVCSRDTGEHLSGSLSETWTGVLKYEIERGG